MGPANAGSPASNSVPREGSRMLLTALQAAKRKGGDPVLEVHVFKYILFYGY